MPVQLVAEGIRQDAAAVVRRVEAEWRGLLARAALLWSSMQAEADAFVEWCKATGVQRHGRPSVMLVRLLFGKKPDTTAGRWADIIEWAAERVTDQRDVQALIDAMNRIGSQKQIQAERSKNSGSNLANALVSDNSEDSDDVIGDLTDAVEIETAQIEAAGITFEAEIAIALTPWTFLRPPRDPMSWWIARWRQKPEEPAEEPSEQRTAEEAASSTSEQQSSARREEQSPPDPNRLRAQAAIDEGLENIASGATGAKPGSEPLPPPPSSPPPTPVKPPDLRTLDRMCKILRTLVDRATTPEQRENIVEQIQGQDPRLEILHTHAARTAWKVIEDMHARWNTAFQAAQAVDKRNHELVEQNRRFDAKVRRAHSALAELNRQLAEARTEITGLRAEKDALLRNQDFISASWCFIGQSLSSKAAQSALIRTALESDGVAYDNLAFFEMHGTA